MGWDGFHHRGTRTIGGEESEDRGGGRGGRRNEVTLSDAQFSHGGNVVCDPVVVVPVHDV